MKKNSFALLFGIFGVLLSACAPTGPVVLSLADIQSGSGRNRASQVSDASLLKLPEGVEYAVDAVLSDFPNEMPSWSITPTKESRAALVRLGVALNVSGEVVKNERNSFSIGAVENSNVGLWLWVDIGGGWWSYFSGLNPEGNENLLSTSDAVARAKSILSNAQIPTQSFNFIAVKKALTTEVTGLLTFDQYRTNVAISFTFGANGVILQASGPLVDTTKALVYPIVSAQDAVSRLTNEKYASIRTSNVVGPAGVTANAKISITGAELTLMQIVLNNRSTMLLPAYRFTNAQGEVGIVLAISDKYLSFGDSSVTGGVEPVPAPLPTTPPTKPPSVVNPTPAVLTTETANNLIGLTETEATKLATGNNWLVRIAQRDGEDFMLTTDYVTTRVNFVVVAGVVTEVTIG